MSVLLLCKRQCSRKVSTATRGLKRKRFPKEAIFRQTIINNLLLYKLCSVNQNLICHLNFEYGKFEKLTNTPKSHTKKCGKSRIFSLLIIFSPYKYIWSFPIYYRQGPQRLFLYCFAPRLTELLSA